MAIRPPAPGGRDIDTATVKAICESVVGSIPSVRISMGLFGATILLRDEPVITVSPYQGALQIRTRTWLKARPPKSSSLDHHTSKADEDWQICSTGLARDLAHVLHLAEPGIRYRATLPQLIAAQLGGVPHTVLVQTAPEYWLALARWIEGSGQLRRPDAMWARRYAKQLRSGGAISEKFRAWAVRTAASAELAGFSSRVPIDNLPGVEDAVDGVDSEEFADVSSEVAPAIVVASEVQAILEMVGAFTAADLLAIAQVSIPDNEPIRRARLAIYKAGRPDERRATKAVVAEAFATARARLGGGRVLATLQALATDAAVALALGDSADANLVRAVVLPWESAIAAVDLATRSQGST